ncbi:hypothetical protein ZWY2020_034339 [Hordeum vulgare]|nr:hypothetical protein ZWY2020_034339 [Hordeum vulgare]
MPMISPLFFPLGQAGKPFNDPPPAVLARGEGGRRRPCSRGVGRPPPAVLAREERGRLHLAAAGRSCGGGRRLSPFGRRRARPRGGAITIASRFPHAAQGRSELQRLKNS